MLISFEQKFIKLKVKALEHSALVWLCAYGFLTETSVWYQLVSIKSDYTEDDGEKRWQKTRTPIKIDFGALPSSAPARCRDQRRNGGRRARHLSFDTTVQSVVEMPKSCTSRFRTSLK